MKIRSLAAHVGQKTGNTVSVGTAATLGWAFVPKAKLVVLELGFFDYDARDVNGNPLPPGGGLWNLHRIGLWRAGKEKPKLLTSVDIPKGTGARLYMEHRWVPIRGKKIVLQPETLYVLGATDPNVVREDEYKYRLNPDLQIFDCHVEYAGSRLAEGTGLRFPNLSDGTMGYVGPNLYFEVQPCARS